MMTNDDKRITMAHITFLKLLELNKPSTSINTLLDVAVKSTDDLLAKLERAKLEKIAINGEVYS